MHNDEKFASKQVAISFAGFDEQLVIPFIKKLSNYSITHLVLLTSLSMPSDEKRKKNEEILSNAKKLIRSFFPSIEVNIFEFRDIWDFYEYIKFISGYSGETLYVNVSAGPSTFSSAATVYSVLNGHHIFYNVEENIGNKSFFVEADLTSLKHYFLLDPLDVSITSIVGDKTMTRKQIYRELSKKGYITERAVSYRIEELVYRGLLIQTGKKPYEYNLTDSLKKMI